MGNCLRRSSDSAALRLCVASGKLTTIKEGEEDMPIQFEVGDIVRLKKQHPCGSNEWEVLRVGADFRLKCLGCSHQVMLARKLVEKNLRGIRKKEESGDEGF